MAISNRDIEAFDRMREREYEQLREHNQRKKDAAADADITLAAMLQVAINAQPDQYAQIPPLEAARLLLATWPPQSFR